MSGGSSYVQSFAERRPDGNQVPQPKHVARQVGESYKDWGARLAGQLRAAELEIERLRAELAARVP